MKGMTFPCIHKLCLETCLSFAVACVWCVLHVLRGVLISKSIYDL